MNMKYSLMMVWSMFKKTSPHLKKLHKTQKRHKMKNFLYTAREVIEFFDKKLHLKMSESNFTKHKKAKIFKIYKKEGKKGDFYKLPESAIDYFNQVNQRSIAGMEAMDNLNAYLKEYKAKEELENQINKQWDILTNNQDIDFKMFDISDMWINAAANLEELKERELKGETVDDPIKRFTLEGAAKTKTDHLNEFKKDVEADMKDNVFVMQISEDLIEKLGEKYKSFKSSSFEHDILEIMASWITTPEKIEEFYGVDLIEQ